ncbi:hypothetical protein D915_008928 [Fasciola hepatica]|uniref:Uncharacterized protein n=1 Tax=Fasciola hepatica TaxID=6192 RepID=A0A4E0R0I9_FASHE|nr:hypothetical protein D915_008928 [Fasciola hepatica]
MRWGLETFRWTVYFGFPLASFALISLPSKKYLQQCAERAALFEETGVDPCPDNPISLEQALYVTQHYATHLKKL